MRRKVIDGGKRSKTLSKAIGKRKKESAQFSRDKSHQKEALLSHKLQDHAYE